MMYEIWAEGYSVTGNRADAILMGKADSETFHEACKEFFGENHYFNADKITYWGCRLFDNEKDARKSFG